MGIGDEIMVAGEVRRRAAGTNRRFMIRETRPGRPSHRWHDIWIGNPRIAAPGQPYDDSFANHGGNRPYIQSKTGRFWVWKEYVPEPGELFLTDRELAVGKPFDGGIVLQPIIKVQSSPNKQWRMEYWQALVNMRPDFPWVQIGDGTEPRLAGVPFLRTASFRDACGVLAHARAAVLQDGGLHHACAALGVPAVVIFGGFISPKVTGYSSQRNLFTESSDHPLGCGMRVPCFHCHRAMLSIKPVQVIAELEEALKC